MGEIIHQLLGKLMVGHMFRFVILYSFIHMYFYFCTTHPGVWESKETSRLVSEVFSAPVIDSWRITRDLHGQKTF